MWRNPLTLKSKKEQGIFGETFILALKTVSRISFNLFCLRDKGLLSEFLRKSGWFQGQWTFSQISWLKVKILKNWEKRFCRWKSTDNNEMNIFLSLENPCTFFFAKEKTRKRVFNTNSELSQNRTEKQMPSKTTINWLFNNIWCYLFVAYFYRKVSGFQKTVVRVYYILNRLTRTT